jgi:hypothetical protein
VILILTHPLDPHGQVVARELEERGLPTRILWLADLGQGATMSMRAGGRNAITLASGERLEADDVDTVWLRRLPGPDLPASVGDPDDRNFVSNEWQDATDAFLRSLDARFVSPMDAQRSATKPRQLEIARRLGLLVPDTLVTNDRDDAEAFIRDHAGHVVHKTLTPPIGWSPDTRRWHEDQEAMLPHLAAAPTIFQKEIVGPADARWTVVGDRVFPVRIETSVGRSEVDSRLDLGVPYVPYEPPAGLVTKVRELLGRLGLIFATVDFKITSDGDHFFLEVNPQGQFLYVEILTRLDIAKSVADLLAEASTR